MCTVTFLPLGIMKRNYVETVSITSVKKLKNTIEIVYEYVVNSTKKAVILTANKRNYGHNNNSDNRQKSIKTVQ